ncbi:GntR family transcriptional regulator [Pseudorhodobacter turbinis]|uniref:GntR family transcriptional regulator n=1 Tax=Pseudorhodobacter turbinis TaxID=2500533 RepID=A0A4P8EIA6_9RHOB|nr:GntR family transcriptional regulator [Pseudorhodobacter turbinis]QCO56533.1 GntR family transcriptional regulator [Pseudorhodobacter turbinis]
MTDIIETLGDSTFKQLKAMILDGRLKAGARLSEKKFADSLGVSRTPVREAIAQLVSEGLAVRSAGGTPVVNSISLNDIMEILHVRSLLECEAARKAALSAQPKDELLSLKSIISGFLTGPRPSAEDHTAIDMQLHSAIARLANSKLLTELIDGLKIKTRMYDQGSLPDRMIPGCHEHIALIDAILDQDPDSAASLMKAHLANARFSIISHIYHPF